MDTVLTIGYGMIILFLVAVIVKMVKDSANDS